MITVLIPSYSRSFLLEKATISVASNSRYKNNVIVLSPEKDKIYQDICDKNGAFLIDDHSRKDGRRVKSLWQILNYGIEVAKEDFVCWLNDDCTVLKDWDLHALKYFQEEDCGLVTLRTRHASENKDFIIIPTLYDVPCANYGVIRKADGLRFDERFSWFHGDADIALQAEFLHRKTVYGTDEPCVIHEHHQDQIRASNEADARSREDWIYLNKKWKGFSRIGTFRIYGFPARIVNGARSAVAFCRRVREKLHAKKSAVST